MRLAVVALDRRELCRPVDDDVDTIEGREARTELGVELGGDVRCDAPLEDGQAVMGGDPLRGGRGRLVVRVSGDPARLEDDEQGSVGEIGLDLRVEELRGHVAEPAIGVVAEPDPSDAEDVGCSEELAAANEAELGARPEGAGLTVCEAQHPGLRPCRSQGSEDGTQTERLVVGVSDDGDGRAEAGQVAERRRNRGRCRTGHGAAATPALAPEGAANSLVATVVVKHPACPPHKIITRLFIGPMGHQRYPGGVGPKVPTREGLASLLPPFASDRT